MFAIFVQFFSPPQTAAKVRSIVVLLGPVQASHRFSIKWRFRYAGFAYRTIAMAVAVDRANTPTESLLLPDRKESTMRANEVERRQDIAVHHQCSKRAIRKRNVHIDLSSAIVTIVVIRLCRSDVNTASPIDAHKRPVLPAALVMWIPRPCDGAV